MKWMASSLQYTGVQNMEINLGIKLLILVQIGASTILSGFRFQDNLSNTRTVPGQGTVKSEYLGSKSPDYFSICMRVNVEFDRFDQIPLFDITTLDSGAAEIATAMCKY